MAINPVQLPQYHIPGAIDFSPLANLGNVYRQAQARQTLSNLQRGPDGQVDTAPLYASGDLSLANLGMQIDRNRALDSRDTRDFQFRKDEAARAQQNADRSFTQQTQQATQAQQNADRNYNLQVRTQDRADAKANQPETTREITNWNFYRSRGGTDDFDTYTAKNANKGTTVNVGGGSDKQIFDTMGESATAARSARTGLQGLREARQALDGGIISGAYADKRLGLQKVGALLGLDSSKIVNTETFRAAIAPQVAAMIKATVGTTNISNTDREFAEKAAGGNINLDEGAIKRLVNIMEKAGNGLIQEHQRRLDAVYPSQTSVPNQYQRERALFGVEATNAGDAVDWRDYFGGGR